MHTAERIRRLGFKRWYERALLEGHAYLVTCFLGLILAVAGIEVIGTRQGIGYTLLGVVLSATGVALSAFGLRFYHRIMCLAEHLSAGASCPKCGRYAVFQLLASGPADATETDASVWLRVRCRECEHEWCI